MLFIVALALIATCLSLPVIEHPIADSALSDVQAEIQALPTISKDMIQKANEFDAMLKKKAAEADSLATDSVNQIITKIDAAEKRVEDHETEKMAHPPVHMTPEEKNFIVSMENAQRNMDKAMKTILSKYASATVAAKNAYTAALNKLGTSQVLQNATSAAEMAFAAAQGAAVAQQNAAVKAAQATHDAAVKKAHDFMDAALEKRQFEKHEQQAINASKAIELADEKLREKLAVKAEAEVKAMNKTSPKQPKNPQDDKKLSEILTEMVEVFQEVDLSANTELTPDEEVAQLAADPANFFEEVPDMTPAEVQAAMAWIKQRTVEAKLPFCWRDSYGRGAGWVPGRVADCPKGWINMGATCLLPADTISTPSKVAYCPADYTNMGYTCYRGPYFYGKTCCTIWGGCGCPEGYTDTGCTCDRLASSLGPSSMSCAPYGNDYFQSAYTARCHKNCASDYTSTGETCYRAPVTRGMDAMTCNADEYLSGARCYPKPQGASCKSTEDFDAGLCYPKCSAGFYGVGPVCWQYCPNGLQTDCGMGCAASKKECQDTVTNQVLGPIMVAAYFATAGGSGLVQSTIKLASGESKLVTTTSKIGGKLVKAVAALQKGAFGIQMGGTSMQTLTRITKILDKADKVKKVLKGVQKVSKEVYETVKMYQDAFSAEFADQTSPAINAAVDARYGVGTATSNFIKKSWSDIQLNEMAITLGAAQLSNVMSVAALADPSGIVDTINAYAKPICYPKGDLPCSSFAKQPCVEAMG